MSIKGYATSQKLDRVPGEYACIVPTGDSLNALAVQSSMYVYLVGSDTVDAGTTASTIVAAGIGAVAHRGDIIRFTSGTFSGVEVKVLSTATNSVTLTEDLSAAPATNVTFLIRIEGPVASKICVTTVEGSMSWPRMKRNAFVPAATRWLMFVAPPKSSFNLLSEARAASVRFTASTLAAATSW